MVKSKLRHEDERCSEIVSMFLDKHFYKTIFDKPEFQIERICQLHPPKGGCLSKGVYPLTWHVDKCSY